MLTLAFALAAAVIFDYTPAELAGLLKGSKRAAIPMALFSPIFRAAYSRGALEQNAPTDSRISSQVAGHYDACRRRDIVAATQSSRDIAPRPSPMASSFCGRRLRID